MTTLIIPLSPNVRQADLQRETSGSLFRFDIALGVAPGGQIELV